MKNLLFILVMLAITGYYSQIRTGFDDSAVFSDEFIFEGIVKKTGIINSPRSWSVAKMSNENEEYSFSRGGHAKKYLRENVEKGELVLVYWYDSCSKFSFRSIHNCRYMLVVNDMDMDHAIKSYEKERKWLFFSVFIVIFIYSVIVLFGCLYNRRGDK